MGLLDDLLGQLGGGGRAQSRGFPQPGRAGTPGGGMGNVLVALLPIVLGLLANRRAGAAPDRAGFGPDAGAGGGLGGLGDLLGGILGGSAGAAPGSGGGGLGDLLEGFRRAGYGDQASSWVSRGQNLPIPPDALEQVFGRDGMSRIAQQAGVSEDEAAQGLSQLLPEVVDRMTPEGEVPNLDSLAASVDAFAQRYGLD